jgi:hypothetical protein
MFRPSVVRIFAGAASLWLASASVAQQVCLPAPRLLTLMPMGGQAGTSVEVTITGENIEDTKELLFSTPKLTAKAKTAADGKVEPNKFIVTIAADAPSAVHDARVMTRLGISSARGFSIGTLPEVTRDKPNTSLATALDIKPNTVCNAAMTRRAVDFYSFEAKQGRRVVVDCAAAGIDSKLTAVLIIADAQGRDLLVNRTGGVLDFTPPADGRYFIKVHGLTFQGGPEHFYRLALMDAPGTGPTPQQPGTSTVSSFSWMPEAPSKLPQIAEAEPNNKPGEAQKITLPCEITGRFFPAADVDTYEFTAKKGDVWWIEAASERLGLPTDPFVLVQRITKEGAEEKLADVAEFNDIAPPMKPSTNGYSYDGPPYDAGSADPLGKLEIKEDGIYRMQIRDLFGGTRMNPNHIYKLIVRKAAPDFSIVAWALHMTLRNGDRAALSKPIALRAGATMALEVVTVRKDGFDGEIALSMENLPAGVSACGLKIPAGKTRGMLLITAEENAVTSFTVAKIIGHAQINGAAVSHESRLASMTWPVRDATGEIPIPRLLADIPVSVVASEGAPLTVAAAERKVWEVKAGDKLIIPMKAIWRSEFAGTSIKLRAFGEGFEGAKELDVPLKATNMETALDFATLKTPPGEYTFAFYGPAVIKYRHNPDAVRTAEQEQKKAEQEALAIAEAAKKLADEAKAAPAEKKTEADNAAKAAVEKLKVAEAMKTTAASRMKAATDAATPKDTAEIVVSEPIRILIKPADKK